MKTVIACTVPSFAVWSTNEDERSEPIVEPILAWEQIEEENRPWLRPMVARGLADIEPTSDYNGKRDEELTGIIVSDRFHIDSHWCTLKAVPTSTQHAMVLLRECELADKVWKK